MKILCFCTKNSECRNVIKHYVSAFRIHTILYENSECRNVIKYYVSALRFWMQKRNKTLCFCIQNQISVIRFWVQKCNENIMFLYRDSECRNVIKTLCFCTQNLNILINDSECRNVMKHYVSAFRIKYFMKILSAEM